MRITLHGAAGEVTGSAYLVETRHARILVDFGMFQGGARLEARNRLPVGLCPKRLHAVLVTHAHLDHVGRLPLLVRGGFAGHIHATNATRDLAALILRDSAKVQSYDVARQNRKRERLGKPPLKPLYGARDVEQTMARFRDVEFGQAFEPAPGITARYAIAGHMLGSASIQLSVREGGKTKTVVFSGDLGPPHLAIVRDAVPFEHADLVFLESTYGDRDNKPMPETLAEFRAIIEDAAERRARILVPAFAVGRTQQILYHVDELFCAGLVRPFPVFLDSPMAIEATRIYRRHPDLFDADARVLGRACEIARRQRHVRPTPAAEDSMKLNDVPGPCLIMAGSGMCNAGRILHHLKHGLWQPDTVVIIVGYQGVGSLGRRLVEGEASVRILGERVAVKAHIHTLNGFSAHAGQSALLEWIGHLASARPRVVLTHGEERGREPLARLIRERHGLKPRLPMQGESVTL
ncbi:MAG TPA: MBL fold metallo-hydrolase [Verrucomicrobiota bacterium]|nr:MBL fold metallo-hydrolase [Verrucomicrobiota bacterium]